VSNGNISRCIKRRLKIIVVYEKLNRAITVVSEIHLVVAVVSPTKLIFMLEARARPALFPTTVCSI